VEAVPDVIMSNNRIFHAVFREDLEVPLVCLN